MRCQRLATLILMSVFVVNTLLVSATHSATSDASLNVGLVILPASSGGGGGDPPPPPPPGDTAPTISNVVIDVSSVNVTVSWSASDDKAITGVSFVYGLTVSYGATGSVGGSYATALSGLDPNTQYFFKISVSDSVGHTTTETGAFVTGSALDTTPPIITNVTVLTGIGSATIAWTTNEATNAKLRYGLTTAYGVTIPSDSTFTLGRSMQLSGLLPNTTYHYQITAADVAGNTSSKTGTFKTAPDSTPPADVSGLVLTVSGSTMQLQWTNPADTDFSGVKIVRKIGGPSTGVGDGTTVYSGSGQSFTDTSPAGGTLYYYTVFSFDTSFNYSGGIFQSGQTSAPAGEVCDNNIDDNGNTLVDCADSACVSFLACATQPSETCNNGIDDNHNGKTDCADAECSGASYCVSLSPEICSNGSDDDNNGQTDCADVACFGFSGCVAKPPDELYEPPHSTVPPFARISINDLRFLAGNRHIRLTVLGGAVANLAGTTLTIGMPKTALAAPPVTMIVTVDGRDNHQFVYDDRTGLYFADVIMPPVGAHNIFVEIDYGASQMDAVAVPLNSLPLGNVVDGSAPLGGVMVSLLSENGQKINTENWGSPNPRLTNANGTYGWVAPNGRYYLSLTKSDYYSRVTVPFLVDNNIVNIDLSMVRQPPDLLEDVSASSTLQANLRAIGKNVAANAKAANQRGIQKLIDTNDAVNNFKNDVGVQETAATVIAPAIVSVAAISTLSLISWANLIPFLRFLFLQPLMLLGLRRRKGWGQVYNALNKLPVDLVTVRLINHDTGRVVQSRVTDTKGRYVFVASPGNYRIEALRNNFIFPSALLAGFKDDGRRPDVYHGELIKVSENDAVITVNIPLDPVGQHKRPRRIFWQQLGRSTQLILSWFGVIITIVSLYISPRWYVWVLLGVHILLFIIFRRLAVPPKVKSWGIVYDSGSKKPVGRAVARLFNSQFNKLVSTQITDSRGRYYFLAGDTRYYVTYDHPEYTPGKTNIIDLNGKEAENIAIDIALKKSDISPVSAPPPATQSGEGKK